MKTAIKRFYSPIGSIGQWIVSSTEVDGVKTREEIESFFKLKARRFLEIMNEFLELLHSFWCKTVKLLNLKLSILNRHNKPSNQAEIARTCKLRKRFLMPRSHKWSLISSVPSAETSCCALKRFTDGRKSVLFDWQNDYKLRGHRYWLIKLSR